MATTKKAVKKKKAGVSSSARPKGWSKRLRGWLAWVSSPFRRLWQWRKSLQPRSPHKNFRRTYRRDYVRPLELPGYIAFTVEVWRVLWRYRSTFGWLVIVYALVSGLLMGIASQGAYIQLAESLRSATGNVLKGDIGQLGEVSSLLGVLVTGGLNTDISESQQLLGGFAVLMGWLTTVWLLRAFLAGQKPRLRDGLYNAGAPIIPTGILSIFLVFQLVPATVAAIGISAAMPTGLISEGVESMLFWAVVLLLVLLSLYWVTSTLIALVVVTLPGVYPLQALKTAHELVVGRRLRILYRILWFIAVSLVVSMASLAYVILMDALLKKFVSVVDWLPVVPLGLLIIGSFTVVWTASYVYLLYRKVVDDNAAPD